MFLAWVGLLLPTRELLLRAPGSDQSTRPKSAMPTNRQVGSPEPGAFPGPNPSKPTFLVVGDADPHFWKIEFQGWAVGGDVRRWFRSVGPAVPGEAMP